MKALTSLIQSHLAFTQYFRHLSCTRFWIVGLALSKETTNIVIESLIYSICVGIDVDVK